ncbi:MAG: hypothetical protein FJ276_26285 [Planctomycetes bacterium]|nr:hypothetical protein [Planctomycetota bacterium]
MTRSPRPFVATRQSTSSTSRRKCASSSAFPRPLDERSAISGQRSAVSDQRSAIGGRRSASTSGVDDPLVDRAVVRRVSARSTGTTRAFRCTSQPRVACGSGCSPDCPLVAGSRYWPIR